MHNSLNGRLLPALSFLSLLAVALSCLTCAFESSEADRRYLRHCRNGHPGESSARLMLPTPRRLRYIFQCTIEDKEDLDPIN
jgi:hypothetical protein